MVKITLINDDDGNIEFKAEGETRDEALTDALSQLGWTVTEEDAEEAPEVPA